MKINPVFIPDINSDSFLVSHAYPIDVEGEVFFTAPILTNRPLNLLEISHHAGLASRGLIDMTDSIDGQVSIAKAYLSIRGEAGIHAVEFDTSLGAPDSQKYYANKSIEGTRAQLVLNLQTTGVVRVEDRDVPVIWSLTGLINLQTGKLDLIAPNIDSTRNAEVVAVELNLERVNINRKPA